MVGVESEQATEPSSLSWRCCLQGALKGQSWITANEMSLSCCYCHHIKVKYAQGSWGDSLASFFHWNWWENIWEKKLVAAFSVYFVTVHKHQIIKQTTLASAVSCFIYSQIMFISVYKIYYNRSADFNIISTLPTYILFGDVNSAGPLNIQNLIISHRYTSHSCLKIGS